MLLRMLIAAKAGATVRSLAQAQAAWYVNGRQVADFFSAAN